MVDFLSAVPKMASANIADSIEFYRQKLGFTKVFAEDDYGSARRGAVEIHFWLCAEKHIAENTGCRVEVTNIDALYAECQKSGVVHPNGLLTVQIWGEKDFSILDLDGNLITFFEPLN